MYSRSAPPSSSERRPWKIPTPWSRWTTSEPGSMSSLKAAAASVAGLRPSRAKRVSYPRGQLKERIGFLRRVRAMLGVVVLTVVLGVAAGAAIGAFLLFLAFAVRNAITSN